jgi:cysteinyl-tRNA synthetase
MPLKVYDTLRGKIVSFRPITKGSVSMYVCGPTVYDSSHLGHARTYIAFDLIIRYLFYKKYKVKYIVNITDIDDKIINRARELGVSPNELAAKFEKMFMDDIEALGIRKADFYPKVSDHIQDIIAVISTLIDCGYAYAVDGDVYFDVSMKKDIGKLSRQSLDEIKAGARVEINERKRDPVDFALWKKAKEGEPFWESPFGKGRPGWHIECSTMAMKHLGKQIDIHGGARDLIFPHHENEIAQSEAYSGKAPFAKYWLHTGFLTIKGEKMSKSLGNFITIRDVLDKYEADTLRLFFASAHYRSPIDYSEAALQQATQSLRRIHDTLENLNQAMKINDKSNEQEEEVQNQIKELKKRFTDAMDNDFNTAKALAVFFELVRIGNIVASKKTSITLLKKIYNLIITLGNIFGLHLEKIEKLSPEAKKLIFERNLARKNKNWKRADEIRNKLNKLGISLSDYPTGTTWSFEKTH